MTKRPPTEPLTLRIISKHVPWPAYFVGGSTWRHWNSGCRDCREWLRLKFVGKEMKKCWVQFEKSCNMLLFEWMQSLVQNASGKALEETKTYKTNNQPMQMMIIYYITYSNCSPRKGTIFAGLKSAASGKQLWFQVYHSLTPKKLESLGLGAFEPSKAACVSCITYPVATFRAY